MTAIPKGKLFFDLSKNVGRVFFVDSLKSCTLWKLVVNNMFEKRVKYAHEGIFVLEWNLLKIIFLISYI